MVSYQHSNKTHEEILSPGWYERAFPELTKLSHHLKNVDLIDGRVVKVADNLIVFDDNIEQKLHIFKSVARAFLGTASVQQSLTNNCFRKPNEREPITLNSLTKACNFLDTTVKQRKSVRLKICQQVTQHRILTGALIEILDGLKSDLELIDHQFASQGSQMGRQIVSTCLKFLDNMTETNDLDSTTWMRPAPAKKVSNSLACGKWEDVLEMFTHLITSLSMERKLHFHVSKLEVMKEGLFHIRDVLIDRNIGYREVQHQENLLQKMLTKTLGHSSKCLFTLLQYYLCSSVRDIEIEVCGGIYRVGRDHYHLCVGRILTSDEENMIWAGVKQLDRALVLFRFVWETAEKKGRLDLQGHLWCIGAKSRSLAYRGNMFFVHGISL